MATNSPEFIFTKRKAGIVQDDPESSDGEGTSDAEFSLTQNSKSWLLYGLNFIYMFQDGSSI